MKAVCPGVPGRRGRQGLEGERTAGTSQPVSFATRPKGMGTFTLAYARARLPGHCGSADHL